MNFEDFYNEIRAQFPTMRELETWDKYDWSLEGYENSLIMTELSMEVISWLTQGKESDVKRFMNIIERYFNEGDLPVTSIIHTVFLVTIIGSDKNAREKIKNMMGTQTKMRYQNLLNFYREQDT